MEDVDAEWGEDRLNDGVQVCLDRVGREDDWEGGFFVLHPKRQKPIQMQQQCIPRLTVTQPREMQKGPSEVNRVLFGFLEMHPPTHTQILLSFKHLSLGT